MVCSAGVNNLAIFTNLEFGERSSPALSKVWGFMNKKYDVISIGVNIFLVSGNNRDVARFDVSGSYPIRQA